jgi:hypothetical protein
MKMTFPIGDYCGGLTLHSRPQGSWRWQKRGEVRVGFGETLDELNDLRFKNTKVILSKRCAIGATSKSSYYGYNSITMNALKELEQAAAETMANLI